MIRHDPRTRAHLLRSTHLLEVAIVAATPGEWTVSGRFRVRRVAMIIRLDRVLKGLVDRPEGSTCAIEVQQFAPAGPFLVAVPGAWSGHQLEAGGRFVAFSISDGTSLTNLLVDGDCRLVLPAAEALPDIELARLAGSPEMPLPLMLERTADRRGGYGSLFAEYVAARLPEVLFSDPAGFDVVMRTIEDPALASGARQIILEDVYTKMIMLDPAPPAFVARLIDGTLRVLAIPGTDPLVRNLFETYLPNLVGLEGAAVPKSASTVFAGRPDVQARAADAFRAAGTARAVAWIQS